MMPHPLILAAVLVALCLPLAMPARSQRVEPQPTRPDGKPNRAVWMARGSFGVMTHYLITPKGDTPEERTADLNRIVDAFDVGAYVRQVEQTGAEWVIFTLGQTTGYLCSPNAYLDSRAKGLTPRRDIVMELAKRLDSAGIRLMLYLPSEQAADPAIRAALDGDSASFADRYFAFLKEYSTKFGRLCHGWWFDACGPHDEAYWQRYLGALRAGNPYSVVAFSGAELCCGAPVQSLCTSEDYFAGEIHLLEDGRVRRDFLPPGGDIVVVDGKLRLRGQEARTWMPDGPFVGNVQLHCLLPLDLTFNPAVPNAFCRYPDKELFGFVDAVKKVGGAVTINIPVDIPSGAAPTDSLAQLARLAKWLKNGKK